MLRKLIIPIVSISLLLLGSSLACAVDAVRIPSGDLKISNGDIRLPTTGSGIVLSDSSVMRKLSDAGGIGGTFSTFNMTTYAICVSYTGTPAGTSRIVFDYS